MTLPEDIRLKIEKRGDKDEILEVIESLQSDGVTITNDVYTAIVTTLRLMHKKLSNNPKGSRRIAKRGFIRRGKALQYCAHYQQELNALRDRPAAS